MDKKWVDFYEEQRRELEDRLPKTPSIQIKDKDMIRLVERDLGVRKRYERIKSKTRKNDRI